MVIAHITMTRSGVVAPAPSVPFAISARVMMPMVFWASFVP
jgi:hypothetical protein